MRSLTVSVVSHTHWDREWYHSAGRFRQQLVALVDALLEDRVTGNRPFLLDGQAVVLEDYLAVRPEQANRLATLLREGAIEAGPWYVLADGLIPSGEAVVRNLQAGRRTLRRFGATAPAVAYCPDTFGHSHAIPTIAHGFGFPLAITWRGYGGRRAPFGDTVRWQSENGAEVVMYHLPPNGYETGSALPVEPGAALKRWNEVRATLGARSNTGIVLLPNGADHHALQPDIAEALTMLQHAAMPDVVVRESLASFSSRLMHAVTANSIALPSVQGELRDSYGYTWTLAGTLGTRAGQKRANAKAERTLLRDVEPWLVLAWLHGAEFAPVVSPAADTTLVQAPALLDAAWRTLLRAHPHDTLCGCSIDAVARAMDVRIESAVLQAHGLRRSALNVALNHDPVVARSTAIAEPSHVVVRNRCAYARGGVAEILLDETLRDIPVGPGSGDVETKDESASWGDEGLAYPARLADLPLQHIQSRQLYRRRESPQHYPDNDLVREHRVLAWVPPVPPLGLSVWPVDALPDVQSKQNSVPNPVACSVVSAETFTESYAEMGNGRVLVRAGFSGVHISFNGGEGEITRAIQNALTFETSRDVGDSYTPAIRGEPELLVVRGFFVAQRGPLRGCIRLRFNTEGKRSRIEVVADLSLDANSGLVRVDIRGENQRRNHRLRVNFHTDVASNQATVSTHADAAFGPVPRPPINVPSEYQAREMVPPTMPMHRWASMTNSNTGATLHSDGLAEVRANESTGTFSLTLLRAIGELSRNNLPERPGHAGWPSPIPMAQSLGRFRARIALQLHGAWCQETRDRIETASDSLLLPLVGETMRDLRQTVAEIDGPLLAGTALRFSTATLADDGDGIVLRCVNDSPEQQSGVWNLPDGPSMDYVLSRIDETPLGEWQLAHEAIEFTSPPRGVVTLRVRRRS